MGEHKRRPSGLSLQQKCAATTRCFSISLPRHIFFGATKLLGQGSRRFGLQGITAVTNRMTCCVEPAERLITQDALFNVLSALYVKVVHVHT